MTLTIDKFESLIDHTDWFKCQQALIDWLWKLNWIAVNHCLDLDMFDGDHMVRGFDSGLSVEDYILRLLYMKEHENNSD